MKPISTLADIIDLEHCVTLDTGRRQRDLHERDRAIYLDCAKDRHEPGYLEMLDCWLQDQRRQLYNDTSRKRPGEQVTRIIWYIGIVLCSAGLIAGFTTGIAFFNYSGANPVNVFHFLVFFVFTQLVLLLFVLPLSTVFRRISRNGPPPLVITLCAALATALFKRRPDTVEAVQLLRRLGSTSGSLVAWMFFTISQRALAWMNGGLLTATLLKITTTDQAFGWQSTIQLSAPFVYRLIRILAAPWSWLVPECYAFPTLDEIEGSRIILKDGVYHLATQDLVSWWPFLLLALLTYGLLPRLLFIAVGTFMQNRSMRRFNLKRPDLQRILQRMRTPLVQSAGESPGDAPSSAGTVGEIAAAGAAVGEPAGRPLLTLVPEDIAAISSAPTLKESLQTYGFTVGEQRYIRLDEPPDPTLLQQLVGQRLQNEDGVLLLMEAWLPPINEWLFTLKQISTAIGEDTPLFIVLLGRPDGQVGFSAPSLADINLWRRTIAAINAPSMSVLALDDAPARKRGPNSP